MTDSTQKPTTRTDSDVVSSRVINLCVSVLICILLSPPWILAQGTGTTEPSSPSGPVEVDISGSETEDAVQPSGMEPEDAIDPSGAEGEDPEFFTNFTEEPYELSPGSGEMIFGPGIEPSAGETEPDVETNFTLPGIELPDFGEIFDLSPSETEPSIFSRRPLDEYYEEVVGLAPLPNISILGPLPDLVEEGVEFTDFAADWIYHQKSVGMTELRGHVMIIYDTTIISCDEAVLDEKNQIYHFFGEGRTFVDDADFTLECDELEIHDADEEKMIYILGASTMVVYADDDLEEPGEDSGRRARLEYALTRQDTTITFTDAEYDYENDIFDAHGGVRFEQSDKYAEGDEFHGEGETDYILFTGDCEFQQEDGLWLYEHRVIEYEEDPPDKSDRLVRALMSVPTKVTSDEAEGEADNGWLQLRSFGGNVVYFHQDDKHSECETFSLWYSGDEDEEEDPEEEGPRNLLEEEEPEEPEEPEERIIPPGFGSLRLASDVPDDYIPWEDFIEPIAEDVTDAELEVESETEEPDEQDFEFEFPEGETTEPSGLIGSLAELGSRRMDVTAPSTDEEGEEAEPINEIIMDGNVFFRQENGDWLFEYDVIREEEETEEDIEQYRKWANASCDYLHVWMDDDNVEATGTIFGEQDNQNLACDFLRYIGELDMLYLRGNLNMHREDKHQLMSEEGFIFFSTNVFEAMGSVQTTVTVDVEERRSESQEGSEEEESE